MRVFDFWMMLDEKSLKAPLIQPFHIYKVHLSQCCLQRPGQCSALEPDWFFRQLFSFFSGRISTTSPEYYPHGNSRGAVSWKCTWLSVAVTMLAVTNCAGPWKKTH